jgi:flagellar motility protein MotE (MotC chaperone)
MSTNPKDLNPIEASKARIAQSKRSADRTLRALNQDMEQENTLVQDTPNARLQKVLKIYRGIKPVLDILGTLALVPSTWRAAIVMFTQALDALTAVGGEITAQFKAGKDLAEQE